MLKQERALYKALWSWVKEEKVKKKKGRKHNYNPAVVKLDEIKGLVTNVP